VSTPIDVGWPREQDPWLSCMASDRCTEGLARAARAWDARKNSRCVCRTRSVPMRLSYQRGIMPMLSSPPSHAPPAALMGSLPSHDSSSRLPAWPDPSRAQGGRGREQAAGAWVSHWQAGGASFAGGVTRWRRWVVAAAGSSMEWRPLRGCALQWARVRLCLCVCGACEREGESRMGERRPLVTRRHSPLWVRERVALAAPLLLRSSAGTRQDGRAAMPDALRG